MEKHDKDVVQVLRDDGVNKVVIGDLENMPTTSIDELIKKMGSGSWAARLVYNDRFGGVVIQQQPGEGNRLQVPFLTPSGLPRDLVVYPKQVPATSYTSIILTGELSGVVKEFDVTINYS